MSGFTEIEMYEALCERHGEAVQERLRQAQVAIAGLGGLGSHIAFLLARIGVGSLHLVDFDQVELCNLNRQQYLPWHVGMLKTEALKAQLVKLNPYLRIRTTCIRVTPENCRELFHDADIVCEAFDRPDQKAMLTRTVLSELPGKKLVASSGMAGYGSGNTIRTRLAAKNFYLCGDEVTELSKEHPVMAPRVVLCAAHQANMITRLILGEEEV